MSKFGTFQNETREGGEGGNGNREPSKYHCFKYKKPVTYRHQNETKKWFFFFFFNFKFFEERNLWVNINYSFFSETECFPY